VTCSRPDVAAAGRQAAAVAITEWLRDVRDLPDDPEQCALITRYLRATGTAAPYPARDLHGRPGKWCGDFWAFCWRGPATGLQQPILDRLIQSTYRLLTFGGFALDEGLWPYRSVRYQGETVPLAEWLDDAPRYARRCGHHGSAHVDIEAVMPGDLLTVPGPGGIRGRWGQGGHEVMAYAVDRGSVVTAEGNSTGPGPCGDHREGVVLRVRRPEEVCLHLRPSWRDLLPGVEYLR